MYLRMFGHFVRPKPEMFGQVSILVRKCQCPTIISSTELCSYHVITSKYGDMYSVATEVAITVPSFNV